MRGGRVTHLIAAVALLGLAACGPVQSAGDLVASAPAKIEAAREAYAGAKGFAELLLPYLSPERQARIRAIEAKVERLLAIAATAESIARQVQAIEDANAAIAELGDAT